MKSEKNDKAFHPLKFFSNYLNYGAENSFKRVLIEEGLILNYSDQIVLQDFVNAIYLI